MTNEEILNRFDVLYNNITSSQAPGLDGYEKSVFWNKATLEVLKNHLNPKGNKYGEGFDFSSKRQVEFSTLTVTKRFMFGIDASGSYNPNNWVPVPESEDDDMPPVLSIINESVEVLSGKAADAYRQAVLLLCSPVEVNLDFNGDENVDINDVTFFVDMLSKDLSISEAAGNTIFNLLVGALLSGETDPKDVIIASGYTIRRILTEFGITGTIKPVVPLTNVEYDTLMSRPYKYPPLQQAWRIWANGESEIAVGANEVPIWYRVRYVKMPKDVNLEDTTDVPEIPEVLHDEVLQRAVELAKAAYVGDMNQQQVIQALGERSE